jgi:hypothetical protein
MCSSFLGQPSHRSEPSKENKLALKPLSQYSTPPMCGFFYTCLGVCNWPLSVPGVLNLSGRNVPEAEVNTGVLNDR